MRATKDGTESRAARGEDPAALRQRADLAEAEVARLFTAVQALQLSLHQTNETFAMLQVGPDSSALNPESSPLRQHFLA